MRIKTFGIFLLMFFVKLGLSAGPFELHTEPILIDNQTDVLIQDLDLRIDESDPTNYAITIANSRNITIKCLNIGNMPRHGIRITNSQNVKIIDTWIHDLAGDSPMLAIDIAESTDILLEGNRLEQVRSGVYVLGGTGIVFRGNRVVNVMGPFPRGQMIQFNKVSGPGNVISGNLAINHHGLSYPEDVISIYKSSGTANSPILIENNFIMGDPDVGSQDMSTSGSGFMLGDSGGGHILSRNNTLLSPGQVGIGVASGENIVVENNLIYGERSNVSNVGIYVWNQAPVKGGAIRIAGNIVQWTNKDGNLSARWQGSASKGPEYEFTEVIWEDNQWNAAEYFNQNPFNPPLIDDLRCAGLPGPPQNLHFK